MASFERAGCYRERVIRSRGVMVHEQWRLKAYDITVDGASVPEIEYGAGVEMAMAALPWPAVVRDRPGVGILIRHPGAGMHYVVVAWWDNQNELVVRVFVRDIADGSGWRVGEWANSFCVWDMRVLWHERNAFVKHVMSGRDGADVEGYLGDFLADVAGDTVNC